MRELVFDAMTGLSFDATCGTGSGMVAVESRRQLGESGEHMKGYARVGGAEHAAQRTGGVWAPRFSHFQYCKIQSVCNQLEKMRYIHLNVPILACLPSNTGEKC